jgi:aspartate/methionine/tyrosine aminotransferase
VAYLDEVAEQVKTLEAEGVAVIKLHGDEPDAPTPPQVQAVASPDLLETTPMASSPSQGLPELRRAIAATYGLTGWRIGYAVSDRATTARMTRLLQLSGTSVPSAIHQAAVNALPGNPEAANARSTKLGDRINLAWNELINHPLSFIRPEGGMYLFPRVNLEGFDSRAYTRTLLATKRVAATPGEAFGSYPDHFWLSLNTTTRDLTEGVKRIGTMGEAWR